MKLAVDSLVFGTVVPLQYELVHHAFEFQSQRNPNLDAIEFQGEKMSYGQLNCHASLLSQHLVEKGIKRGSRVAVVMTRCLEFPIALIGILKAGGVMMPLDASLPAKRILYMIRDAAVTAIITTSMHANFIQAFSIDIPIIPISTEEFLQREQIAVEFKSPAKPTDEVYVVYTSGSTGKPKGAPVLHIGVTNLALSEGPELGFYQGARVMQFMAMGFGGFQWDFWKALSHGATLVLRSDNYLNELKTVDAITCTPTGLGLIGSPSSFPNLKFICVGGEPCPSLLMAEWASHCKFFNVYGSSECSIVTNSKLLHADTRLITIGHPIQNVNCYVLDEFLKPVPCGEIGELYLGGLCASPSYVNLPQASMERFVVDPFDTRGFKMFRSGDMARVLSSGEIQLIGRMDNLVKLKGYRIELDEVTKVILSQTGVISAAVIVKEKSYLAAFVSPASLDIDSIQHQVANELPAYMIPAAWVCLDTLPQNINGKIDKQALDSYFLGTMNDPVVTSQEKMLAEAWASVLNQHVDIIFRNSSFIALGGDSLSAIRLSAVLHRKRILLSSSDILKMSRLDLMVTKMNFESNYGISQVRSQFFAESPRVLKSVNEVLHSKLRIKPSQIEDIYPVTSLQGGMVFATMQDPSNYLIHVVIDINFGLIRFRASWDTLVKHIPVLRTIFALTTFGLYQVVVKDDSTSWRILDHIWSIGELESKTSSYLEDDKILGFTMNERSLNRLTCIPTSAHIVSFGLPIMHFSMDGLLILIMEKLDRLVGGDSLSDIQPSFRDYVYTMRTLKISPANEFWRSKMQYMSDAGCLALPKPFTKPKQRFLAIDKQLTLPDVRDVSVFLGVTPSSIFQAAWAMLLSQYTQCDTVMYGAVYSGRDTQLLGIESIIGALINTIPIVFQVPPSQYIDVYIQSVHGRLLEYRDNINTKPIEIESTPKKEQFDTIFVYGSDLVQREASHFNYYAHLNLVDAALGLAILPQTGGFGYHFNMSYDATAISLEIAHCILNAYVNIISKWTISDIRNKNTSSYRQVPLKELNNIMAFSSGPVVARPLNCVHYAFEQLAITRPTLPAIKFEDQILTCGELNKIASSLAHSLAAHGACVGSRVAVIMGRSLELIVGLVATVKVGASMLTLDAAYPTSQLNYILVDSNVSVVITTDEHLGRVEALEAVRETAIGVLSIKYNDLDPNVTFSPAREHITQVKDEAYVVYTSGSTGPPKGVRVLHESISNTVMALKESFERCGTSVYALLSIGFDVFQGFLWSCLSYGTTFVLPGRDNLELDIDKVDSIVCTPTGLGMLGHPTLYPSLKVVWLGGEMVPTALRELWSPFVILFNNYGPSECAVYTHSKLLLENEPISVGRPIPNVHCYVLDKRLRQVPLGVRGSIYVSGVCVSPGYINLPDLTSQRFVPDPFAGGTQRMYHTGDTGRLLPNGDLEILGREDNQVKLKGYRIELDGIACTMMRYPGVTAAAVLLKDNSVLIGYFSPAKVSANELQDFVSMQLAYYSVPSLWIGLDALPQNRNGKIDRQKLSQYELPIQGEEELTELERTLAQIWSQVLDIEVSSIKKNSNFFALGGDSISLLQLARHASLQNIALSIRNLTKNLSLSGMAQHIAVEPPPLCASTVYAEDIPLSPMQRMMIGLKLKNIHYFNLSSTFILRNSFPLNTIRDALYTLVELHDVFRLVYAYDNERGWSQRLDSSPSAPMVEYVRISGRFCLKDEIMKRERSLHLIYGPLYRVTLFESSTTQYIHFSIHHSIMDMVSWRILLGDFQALLEKKPIQFKSSTFQEWIRQLKEQVKKWNPIEWRDYITEDHMSYPRITQRIHSHRFKLDSTFTHALDVIYATHGVNIQIVALAALLGAYGNWNTHDKKLAFMIESHGRDVWDPSLNLSNTIGWFTAEYPVVFNIVLKNHIQYVKKIMDNVPSDKLSYGAIKYFAESSDENRFIQSHTKHPITFNYIGKFHERDSMNSLFIPMHDMEIPQSDEDLHGPAHFTLSHQNGELILDMVVKDWLYTDDETKQWGEYWIKWMHRLVRGVM